MVGEGGGRVWWERLVGEVGREGGREVGGRLWWESVVGGLERV